MSDDRKLRLYAGTINARPDDAEFRNFTLDISARGVWDRDLAMSVLPDFVMDISSLVDFRDETWDELVYHHVLEHLSLDAAVKALNEARRVLKTGGVLDIEVPDMDEIVKAWHDLSYPPDDLQQWIYGEQLPHHEPGDSHRYGWTQTALSAALLFAGFDPSYRFDQGLALRYRAVKT